ncbi:MAG TPA: TcpQ domain-containing protein, partial [Lysobacter sp.]|nr:TcpQ domain-containing protein [Lysobacter sp.]
RWKAVNRYAEEPQEIPLYEAYVFYPSPMDGTLKTMLTRWARDSKMTLSYLHSSDFTLHEAVAQIHTNDLQEAVSQLTSAYAGQGVSVTTEGNQIVVRSAATATATASVPVEGTAAATP